MTLFGDSKRFTSSVLCHDKAYSMSVIGGSSTGRNVGPGSHFYNDLDDKRNGWKSSSKSVRQPMEKSRRERERSLYLNGEITKDGVYILNSSDKIKYPAPGQYEPPMNISYRLRSSTPNSIRSNSLSRSSSMGSSPRMAPPLTTIKGDVIIPGSFDDLRRSTNRGPGSYFPTDETFSVTSSLTSPLRRKSFNVRSQNGNLLGHQSAMKQMISISQDDSFLHSPIKSKSIKKSTKTAWTHEKTPQTRIEYFTPRTTAVSSKDDKINTPSNRFRSKYDTPYRSTSIPHQKHHHHSSMISNPSPLPHGFHTPVH